SRRDWSSDVCSYDLMKDAGVYDAVLDAFRGGLPSYGIVASAPLEEIPSFDWYDWSARDGISEKYRLSVSGGSEDKVWRVSGSFRSEEGRVGQWGRSL